MIGGRDAAATGADGYHAYRRRQHRQALVEEWLPVLLKHAARDQPDIEAGAAHVAGDDIVISQFPADMPRRHQTADRTGIDDRNRLAGHLVGQGHPTGTFHYLNRGDQPPSGEFILKRSDIAFGHRPDKGVDHGGHHAFEFADARRDFR